MKVEYTIETKTPSTTLPALYQNIATPDFVVLFISAYTGIVVEKPVGPSSLKPGDMKTFSDSYFTGQWKRLEKGSSVTFTQED
jgi:hypothetical protein